MLQGMRRSSILESPEMVEGIEKKLVSAGAGPHKIPILISILHQSLRIAEG